MILEALSEIPSFSNFFLTIDMQLDLTDCEEDAFFPFLEFSINCFCVLKILDSLSIFPLKWGTAAESAIEEQSSEPLLCLSVFSANIY
jgi:hypothetical protein